MNNKKTFSENVLQFNNYLSKIQIELPERFSLTNPFNNASQEIKDITNIFYKRYYNDCHKRRLILGSSPARRGTSVTGIPFEDIQHLQKVTGIYIDNFYINKSSSNFLYEVIDKYGGCEKFYSRFYMNFVCPLGIVRVNSNDKEVNCNYYDNKEVQKRLTAFIVQSIKKILDFGIDRSIAYCIGSGENYIFLTKLNKQYHFFEKIIPLEHPRFIMQYNSKNKNTYIDKYLEALEMK